MNKNLYIFILFSLLFSCTNSDEKFKAKTKAYLRQEIEILQKEVNYNFDCLQVSIISRQYCGNNFPLEKTIEETRENIKKLEEEINKDDYSAKFINQILCDSIFTKYAFKKYEFSIIEFNDTSLIKLQKEVELLRLKKDIYLALYANICGSMKFNNAGVITIEDSNKVNVIFGIFDTINSPYEVYINSVKLNSNKIKIPVSIDFKNGNYKILFNSSKPGKYNWNGGYIISCPNGHIDTLPISGNFEIK